MSRLSLQLCFLHCTLSLLYTSCMCCPQVQKEALLEFKSLLVDHYSRAKVSTEGSLGYYLNSWNSNTSCCEWNGVFCYSGGSPEDEVDGLDLSASVHISSSVTLDVLTPLFRITSLVSLDVSGNSIQGELPVANLSRLVQLQYLKMSDNSFQGNIPSEIGNLTKLQELDLGGNKLSGKIPAEIGNLSSMSTLNLSKNYLTGGIPPYMQQMDQLETLQLDGNQLAGEIPIGLLKLKELRSLHLGGNNLTLNNNGRILLGNRLYELSLRSCNIAGPIPEWLSNRAEPEWAWASGFSFLDLSYNKLEGTFPLWLADLDVGMLVLSDNKLTGSLPASLFQRLDVLDLSRNNFHGELPKTIGDHGSLTVLILSSNNFSGPVPQSISKLRYVDLLDLSNNSFSGDKFPAFHPNATVSCVDLSSNKFSGQVPTSFGKGLVMLSLGQNEFSGHLPGNLTNFKLLEHLDLHDNRITGKIPATLSKLSSLKVLNLRNNSLEGSIPDNLSTLPSLQLLDISNNNLNGSIPSNIGNLNGMSMTHDLDNISLPIIFYYFDTESRLDIVTRNIIVNWKRSKRDFSSKNLNIYTILDLSKNNLSGKIPASLGDLRGLKSLNLSYNSLSGEIPTTFGNLENAEALDLSHNSLSGEIPETFIKLQQINNLDLSNNRLSGRIPESAQMDRLNDPDIYANNSGLCGVQIQNSCEVAAAPQPTPESGTEEYEETWFSWKFAGIGYPIGFFSAIGFVYAIGYFDINARPNHPRGRGAVRIRFSSIAS